MNEPQKINPLFCLTLESLAGSQIGTTIRKAINLAWMLHVLVAFEFNGIRICVGPNTDPDEAEADYNKSLAAKRAVKQSAILGEIRENILVGHVPQFDSDLVREIWNWWNTAADLDTLAEFYKFLVARGAAK